MAATRAPATPDVRTLESWLEESTEAHKARRAARVRSVLKVLSALVTFLRPIVLTLGALVSFVVAAFMLATVLGVVAVGVALLVLEWLGHGGDDR